MSGGYSGSETESTWSGRSSPMSGRWPVRTAQVAQNVPRSPSPNRKGRKALGSARALAARALRSRGYLPLGAACAGLHALTGRQRSRSWDSFCDVGKAASRMALERIMAPGDILCVRGGNDLMGVGTVGGFLGHVMLVVSPPKMVRQDSRAREIASALQVHNVWPLWKVQTMESTRGAEGLHSATLLLHTDSATGELTAVGEVNSRGELVSLDCQTVEVWQPPELLRAHINPDLMQEVIGDMKAREASWSFATAARALLAPSWMGQHYDAALVLQEARRCWKAKPICTSVVISFWQRYFCRAAQKGAFCGSGSADLILRWMPVKADRTLPGELLTSLLRCGWRMLPRVPRSHSRFDE